MYIWHKEIVRKRKIGVCMRIEYHVVDPTRNTTILAEGDVPVARQPEVAQQLMKLQPAAEQVGFVSLSPEEKDIDISLRMAGGEFCGNATMAAAVLFCEKARLPHGEVCDVRVRVCGVEKPVHVDVEITDGGKYNGVVHMPAPLSIEHKEFVSEGRTYLMPIVHFNGISHIIAGEMHARDEAENAIKAWCNELGLDGLGIMLYDSETMRLDPLVYIPAADTLFWESSCASGTTALGAYLVQQMKKPISLKLREPGGELSIEGEPGGELRLGGHVRMLKKGLFADVEC